MKPHPYFPAHMTRTSFGNVPACCDQPAESHLPFPDGEKVRVQLAKDVRHLNGRVTPKGTILDAERSNREDMLQEIRPSRWGTNELGQFAELDKGEYTMVCNPGWTIRLPGDSHLTGIPYKWAKEI